MVGMVTNLGDSRHVSQPENQRMSKSEATHFVLTFSFPHGYRIPQEPIHGRLVIPAPIDEELRDLLGSIHNPLPLEARKLLLLYSLRAESTQGIFRPNGQIPLRFPLDINGGAKR